MNILNIAVLSVLLALCFLAAPTYVSAKDVRPEDYGAIVNDDLDDSAAIQAAVNDIIDAGGGAVLFPSGKLIIRNIIRFVPPYVGGDIKLKGDRGAVIEVSVGTGTNGIAFYGGRLNTWIFEDLTITGTNVPSSHPQFIDAAYVIYSNSVNQTNIVRCQLFGLAVPSGVSVVYFGNTDAKVSDSQFDGDLGLYPDGAVIKAENSRGLTVLRSTFLDYANLAGAFHSKSPGFVGSWIFVSGGPDFNANGQRRVVIEDSRFDEGSANGIRIEDIAWVSIRGISVNVNGTSVGTGVHLTNVQHAIVEQSWFGYTTQSRPALFTKNTNVLQVNSLIFSGGVYFLAKKGQGVVDVKFCPQCTGRF